MSAFFGLFAPGDAKLEAQLRHALDAGDDAKARSTYCKLLTSRVHNVRAQLLSDLILMDFPPKAEDPTFLAKGISPDILQQATQLLAGHDFVEAALSLCGDTGEHRAAIRLLAARGRDDDLAAYLQRHRLADRELLGVVTQAWEDTNDDIRKSNTLCSMFKAIHNYAPQSIPHNPHAKEVVGQFAEAAQLYAAAGMLHDAAACYAEAGMYAEAVELYERLGDRTRVSLAAEKSGDLEKALAFADTVDQRLALLLRLERFAEALAVAADAPDPAGAVGRVGEAAMRAAGALIQRHQFVPALELAHLAGAELTERQRIADLGRAWLDAQMVGAATTDELKTVARERVRLEEAAGNHAEAGRLAEDVLEDLDLASRLYEKANLYDRALGAASRTAEAEAGARQARMRLAELHEKGGNLLNAAALYETAGAFAKASTLYEQLGAYNKAIECHLRTPSPQRVVLLRLFKLAGQPEKAVDLLLGSDNVADLEEALALASAAGLAGHARMAKERLERATTASIEILERLFGLAQREILSAYVPILGIDFGTTNSVVALFNRATQHVEIVLAPRGAEQEPSYFALDDQNRPIFGEDARLRALTAPDCAVAQIKRRVGRREWVTVAGQRYRAEEIVTFILQHLRANALAYLRAKILARLMGLLADEGLQVAEAALKAFAAGQPDSILLTDVVLGVPAYFTDNQKRAMREAAEMAGLKVRRLLHEPTAAALAYSHRKPYSGTVAVVDFGGGTLDISIVEIGDGVDTVRTVGGDTALGGSDIDALLIEHMVDDIRQRWGTELATSKHPAEMARLVDACENLKINLSSATEYILELRHFLNRPNYSLTMTRTHLEQLAQTILTRARNAIETTLKDDGRQVDHVLLVGNATKMPAFASMAVKATGARPLTGIDPGTVVAKGAALQGAVLAGAVSEILVLDVTPYSLGISVIKRDSAAREEEILRLIERNSRIPVRKSTVCTTYQDNQPNIWVRVFQGESMQLQQGILLGDFKLDVPPAPAGTPKLEIIFEIGSDCILTVTAVNAATGRQASIRVEGAVGLSAHELAERRKFYAGVEGVRVQQTRLKQLEDDIEGLAAECNRRLARAGRAIEEFNTRFHDRVERNARLYSPTPEQSESIRTMFNQREQLDYDLRKYTDRMHSARANVARIDSGRLDFGADDIVAKLQERTRALTAQHDALAAIAQAVEQEIILVAESWKVVLDTLKPNLNLLTPLERAEYELSMGNVSVALDALAACDPAESEDALRRVLQLYAKLKRRDEYRAAHKRYGWSSRWVYPDRLDAFVKAMADSVFMIQASTNNRQGVVVGTGFAIAPDRIVTNRHVVEGATEKQVVVIGASGRLTIGRVTLDPINDLAVMATVETLKPLRLGEFDFLEPGEQVVAIGFPVPSSNQPSENVYVSKGHVNSIRRVGDSPERMIFMDAKIRPGMSGGPLFNELGEVVGIVTMVLGWEMSDAKVALPDTQPVALPIYLVAKYLR